MTYPVPGFQLSALRAVLLTIVMSGFSYSVAFSQVLCGRINDRSGQPVQYATVFIRELKQGTTSNTKGDYEIRLPAGKYSVLYQSLGYEPVMANIVLSKDTIRRNIVLDEQLYQIEEVKITASGEDPAYPIMRKAIGLAPYYLNQVIHYKADVYLKGDLVINRIPGIIKKQLKKEAKERADESGVKSPEIKEGDSYFMESFNEIDFNAPDKYVQKVISFNSTFPSEGNNISPMDYIKASFYQPVLVDIAVSPLSPSAFSYYNFRYLGATPQGEYTIDKIEVIPKRKSQQVFSGMIYIIDELSCLQSVDLTNNNVAGTVNVKQLFIPVQKDIWMPVSHNFRIKIGIMGFRADAGYGSSVKYLEVTADQKLKRPEAISGEGGGYVSSDTVMTRTGREIENILKKEELTNRDMVKLSKLMKKETESARDSAGRSLEVTDNTKHIVEKDAGKKDSLYWAQVRPIPLSESELRSLKIRDSLKTAASGLRESTPDTAKKEATKGTGSFVRFIKNVSSGHTWADTSGNSFRFDGLLKLKNLNFNTVDGFVYGLDFRLSKKLGKTASLSLYPVVKYAFNRDKLMWRANVNLNTGGLKPQQAFIRAGMTSRDFNTQGGIDPFLNSLTSLLLERNYLKIYDSRFITLGYRFELLNGLRIEISPGFDYRRTLQNSTSFSIFRSSREYTPNQPPNAYLTPENYELLLPESQRHFEIVTNVTFLPFQKYRIVNGRKSPAGSDWPEFSVTWNHLINSVPGAQGGYSSFDMLMLTVSRRHDQGAFSQLRWRIRTGGFTNNRGLTYYDFFHFNSQTFPVILDDYDDAFMLPAYYSLSTPEFFGEAHLKYTTPYLLLKLLPVLSNTLTRENISLSYLGSRYHQNYTELGYSLSEIFFFGEAGVYAGFKDLNFNSVGFKFIFKLR